MTLSKNYYCVAKFNDSMWVEELVTIATFPLQILQDYCSKSCKTLVWFLHARLCTVHILHGSKTCKKSCKGRLARLLQGLVRLWPLLLQYARFLSKYIRFSCKMCQILMQASLQASCKSLMYRPWQIMLA